MSSKVNDGKAEWSQQAAVISIAATSTMVGLLSWCVGRYQQKQKQIIIQNRKEISSSQLHIPPSVLKSPWIKELMLAVKLATKGKQL
jgi:hypothetical protein